MSESSAAPVVERSGPEQSRLNDMLKDFQEWRLTKGLSGAFKAKFVEEEDAWEVSFSQELPSIYVYLSDIDGDFYHEHAAVMVECQVGGVSADTDLSKYLRFASSEMVLTRLGLRSEDDEHLLVVEGACPYQLVRFEFLELLMQETAAIGADLIDLAEGRIQEDSASE